MNQGLFFRWLLLTVSIMVASYMIDGIHVSSIVSAFFAAAILGLLNTFLRPVLILLTLPINILSFGLFTFVINALLLKLASGLIPGFYVHGFWAAVLGSLLISIVNWVLNSFFNDHGEGGGWQVRSYHERRDTIDLERKDGNRWE
ncbi:MAG: phage holin family protein [Acidobacteriota bacterium]